MLVAGGCRTGRQAAASGRTCRARSAASAAAGRHARGLVGRRARRAQSVVGHAVTSARTGASSVARSDGVDARSTCTRCAPSSVAWPQGVPAVGEQRPGHHADHGGLVAGHVGDQGPQPALRLAARARRSTALTSSSVERRPSASNTSPACCAASTGTRSDRPLRAASVAASASSNGRSTNVGTAEARHRQVLGQHAHAAQLAGPLGGVEPGQLEDDAVDRGRASATASPDWRCQERARTPAAATSMSTAVRGVASRPDGADQCRRCRRPVAEQAAARRARTPGRAGSRRRRRTPRPRADVAALAEPALERGRPAPGSDRSNGRGAPPACSATSRSSGRVRATRRGRPSSRPVGGGGGVLRSIVGSQRPGRFTVEPVLVSGRWRGEGGQGWSSSVGGAVDAVGVVVRRRSARPGAGVGDELLGLALGTG